MGPNLAFELLGNHVNKDTWFHDLLDIEFKLVCEIGGATQAHFGLHFPKFRDQSGTCIQNISQLSQRLFGEEGPSISGNIIELFTQINSILNSRNQMQAWKHAGATSILLHYLQLRLQCTEIAEQRVQHFTECIE